MRMSVKRRDALWLGGAAAGGSFLSSLKLPRLMAADMSLPEGSVQFRPEIEPLAMSDK